MTTENRPNAPAAADQAARGGTWREAVAAVRYRLAAAEKELERERSRAVELRQNLDAEQGYVERLERELRELRSAGERRSSGEGLHAADLIGSPVLIAHDPARRPLGTVWATRPHVVDCRAPGRGIVLEVALHAAGEELEGRLARWNRVEREFCPYGEGAGRPRAEWLRGWDECDRAIAEDGDDELLEAAPAHDAELAAFGDLAEQVLLAGAGRARFERTATAGEGTVTDALELEVDAPAVKAPAELEGRVEERLRALGAPLGDATREELLGLRAEHELIVPMLGAARELEGRADEGSVADRVEALIFERVELGGGQVRRTTWRQAAQLGRKVRADGMSDLARMGAELRAAREDADELGILADLLSQAEELDLGEADEGKLTDRAEELIFEKLDPIDGVLSGRRTWRTSTEQARERVEGLERELEELRKQGSAGEARPSGAAVGEDGRTLRQAIFDALAEVHAQGRRMGDSPTPSALQRAIESLSRTADELAERCSSRAKVDAPAPGSGWIATGCGECGNGAVAYCAECDAVLQDEAGETIAYGDPDDARAGRPARKDETGWLVEDDRGRCLGAACRTFTWTTPNAAVRFARRGDAERVAAAWRSSAPGARAVEHAWPAVAAEEERASSAEPRLREAALEERPEVRP